MAFGCLSYTGPLSPADLCLDNTSPSGPLFGQLEDKISRRGSQQANYSLQLAAQLSAQAYGMEKEGQKS